MTQLETPHETLEQRVLTFVLPGPDAESALAAVADLGMPTCGCNSVDELCAEIARGAGILVVDERALDARAVGLLLDVLGKKPWWSELPTLLLTELAEARVAELIAAMEQVARLTLIERPIRPLILATALRSAIRNRQRQYVIRDHLRQRRQAEQHHRHAESRYRLATEAGGLGTWDLDLLSGQLEASGQLKAIFGFEPDAAATIGTLCDRIHTADRDRAIQHLTVAHRNELPAQVEFRIVLPGGETRNVLARGQAQFDEIDGHRRPVRSIGIVMDVTESRQMEQALRDSEHRYRIVSQLSSDFAFSYRVGPDGETGLEWMTGAFERTTGYPPTSVGQVESLLALAHEDDRQELGDFFDQLRVGVPDIRECRLITRGGEVRWVRIYGECIRDDSRAVTRIVGTAEDISDRMRIEEDLTREHMRMDLERRRLGTVLNILPVGVFIADAEGRITEVNSVARRLWGDDVPMSARPEPTPLPCCARRADSGEPITTDRWCLARALSRGESCGGDEITVNSPAGERTLLSYAVPILDGRGRIDGAVGVDVDITERKRSARQLEELNSILEQKVAERTAMAEHRAAQLRALAAELTDVEQRERRRLAQVLHDHLQQLLVGAKFSLGVLRNRVREGRARDSVAQVDELIDQALEASRSLTVELSPPVLYEENLAGVLRWLGRWMQERHGLKVDVRIAEPAPDPDNEEIRATLFQATRELLFNVVKHAMVDHAGLELTAVGGGHFRIIVDDSGVGFDLAEMRAGSGAAGFGLFSLTERLELMGGRLEVESKPGKGTRIALVSPLNCASCDGDPARRADEAARPRTLPAGKPRRVDGMIRVLLADDHEVMRDGLAGLLEDEQDIEVAAEASDGEMAVSLALRYRPDVIVMDISMPRLNGVEATERICRALPGVRVIGLSMHDEADKAAAMRRAGAVAYLSKGAPAELLLAAIRGQSLLPQDGI